MSISTRKLLCAQRKRGNSVTLEMFRGFICSSLTKEISPSGVEQSTILSCPPGSGNMWMVTPDFLSKFRGVYCNKRTLSRKYSPPWG
jgi:hypothetical protein